MKTKLIKLDYSIADGKLVLSDGKKLIDITDSLLNLLGNDFISNIGGIILENKDCGVHYKLSMERINLNKKD